jgi:hypothetical protein
LRLKLVSRSLSFALAAALANWAATAVAQTPKLQLGGYETSLRLMEQGECGRAEDRLLPNGRAHEGDELIVADLGSCYLRAAAKMNDPEAADRSREIGAGWILTAANAGVRRAQEEAVRLYLDGKVFFFDPYEAGKWYTLWSNNHTQMQFGQIEFDADLLKLMNSSFSASQWTEARARAIKWRPVTLASQTAP